MDSERANRLYTQGYNEGRNGGLLDDIVHKEAKSWFGENEAEKIRNSGYEQGQRDRQKEQWG